MTIALDIVERLRFDRARCEVQFSKGVAGNIEEAAAEIERLRAALNAAADRFDDIAAIVLRDGAYTNVEFFRASARRCREVDFYPRADEQKLDTQETDLAREIRLARQEDR